MLRHHTFKVMLPHISRFSMTVGTLPEEKSSDFQIRGPIVSIRVQHYETERESSGHFTEDDMIRSTP